MSGGKGPSQQGTINKTTENPYGTAQMPFLTGSAVDSAGLDGSVGWNQALNLAIGNPFQYYPGDTLAESPEQLSTYQSLYNTGATTNQTLIPSGNSIFNSAANGDMGIENSPAYTGLMSMADGVELPTGSLADVASGKYLNSNPYLDEMFGSASDAVTRAYQTATAPQTDANFASAGRYGSGAMMNARSNNQQDLAKQLGGLSSEIYGKNYQTERGRMDSASAMLAEIARSGMALESGALNTLQTGFQSGNTSQLQALSMLSSLIGSQSGGLDMMLKGAEGSRSLDQAQIDDAMKRFYGEIDAGWKTNNAYMNQIGQVSLPTGSGSETQPLLGPNKGSSLVSGAGSAVSLATSLASGISKLFSDRRLKRDIERIGELENGLPVYSYRYLWSEAPEVGLMADEVARVHPAAVIAGPMGFDMVDYSRAVLPA
jgi:hypothetical protein